MVCPICKNTDKHYCFSLRDYEYNVQNITEYYCCHNCAAIYRSKLLNEKETEILYDKDIYMPVKGGKLYDFLKKINAYYEKNKLLKLFSNYKKFNKINILDIACGKGYLLEQLVKIKNFQCYGMDINKNIKNTDIKFIKSSYTNLDNIKNIKPQLIIINNFIEHMEDLNIIFKILNLMENNSAMLIITPDSNSKGRRFFKDCWSGYHAPRHKTIFNRNNIIQLFNRESDHKIVTHKMYDPFTNLISAKNLIKKLKEDFSIITLIKVIISPFLIFLDVLNKNRLVILIKKN